MAGGGSHPVDVLNVPYFEFVEREEASVKRVTDWLGARGEDLVVVCAEGGSSAYVAEILQGRGLPAANLAGGMVAWGLGSAIRPSPRADRPVSGRSPLRTGVPVVRRGARGGRRRRRPAPGTRRLPGLLEREGLRLRAVFDTQQPTLKGKRLKERLFSLMTPSRLNRMPVSKMNFGGVGRVMLQSMMRDKQVASIDELFDMARQLGVKLIACTMSMDVMGIAREELIDGVEVGGVATFLGDAARSRVSLFV